MKKLFSILLSFLYLNCYCQIGESNVWDLQGKVLNLNYIVPKNITIKNAIIQANPYIQIFDTTITLVNCRAKEFSTGWFGVYADNSNALNKAITTCISNGIKNLYVSSSSSFSKSLKIFNLYDNNYIGVDLNIYGDSGFWSDATTLTYTGTSGCAIGFQYSKGGSIHNLKIQGQFISPANTGIGYYNLTQSAFNDVSGRCTQWYAGLVIDYDGSKNTGGSTGLKVYDMWIDGFSVLYWITGNQVTQNADILIFTNIRCGNGRIGFMATQPQQKGNQINNIVSWDNIHTLISIGNEGRMQAGNYIINGGNIAGGCIRLFNISENGWFCSHIYGLFAEHFATIGTIYAGDGKNNMPTTIEKCQFDFAYTSEAGVQTLLTTNSNFIKISDCSFRYYGDSTPLKFVGAATFENCFFSGAVSNTQSMLVNFQPLLIYQ